VAVKLTSYSEMKDINSIKTGCVISGGGVMVSNWIYSWVLHTNECTNYILYISL